MAGSELGSGGETARSQKRLVFPHQGLQRIRTPVTLKMLESVEFINSSKAEYVVIRGEVRVVIGSLSITQRLE